MVHTPYARVRGIDLNAKAIAVVNMMEPVMQRLFQFDVYSWVQSNENHELVYIMGELDYSPDNLKYVEYEQRRIGQIFSSFKNIEVMSYTNADNKICLHIYYNRLNK